MEPACLSLGSNLGRRRDNLRRALELLDEHAPGDVVELQVIRYDGTSDSVAVRLGERPYDR